MDLLKKFPGFIGFDESRLVEIARHAEIKNFAAGQIILQEGEFADIFYIIIEGDVRIFTVDSKGERQILARLQKNEFFGEQAFSSSVSPRRTASAESISSSSLYCIPRRVLLDLDKKSAKLKQIIHERFREFISLKTSKLAEKLDSTLHFSEFLPTTKRLDKGEVLYYQGDPALHFFILLNGAIELRQFDEHKILKYRIELGLGEMLGNQTFEDNNIYGYTAVAKESSEVIVVTMDSLKKHIDQIPKLLEYGQKIENQRGFSHYGKAIQFRGQYLDMPAFFTVIFLKDGREIICLQAVNSNIVSIQTKDATSSETIQYNKDAYQLQLHLSNQFLIGVNGVGLWDDIDKLMEIIVQKRTLSKTDLEAFQATGRIDAKTCEIAAEDALLCTCMRVRRKEIETIIKNKKGSACTFEDIREKTRASTVCGSCGPAIMEMLGNDAWIPCRVVSLILHNSHMQTFRLEPISPNAIRFTPGQHVILRAIINSLPISRSYTLTSAPGDNCFEVTIKLEKKGRFSPWIFENAAKNPLIHVSGPYGDFTIAKEPTPIICFGGGIGITPFVAFCRYLAEQQSTRELYIDYSSRYVSDFIFKEEFEQSTKILPHARIHFRETSKEGKISQEEILRILQKFPNPDIYICGPAQFEEVIVKCLINGHVPPEKIHTERFIQAGAPMGGQQLITF